MRTRFEECLKRGKIIPTDFDADLVAKEFAESVTDLQYAERSIRDENLK
nr:hypothetical protein [uncultured Methanospirillum sp.]